MPPMPSPITPENGEMVEFDIPDDMEHAFFRLHRE